MKIKFCMILITAVALACCSISAIGETNEPVLIPDEDWSWSRGAYNTFTGQIDLSDCIGSEVTVQLSTSLPYNTGTEIQSMPVFTSVNGKRIVMTKQSDSIQIIPDGQNPTMFFSASFRLPEKQHVSTVTVFFHVSDMSGKEIKTVSGCIENHGNSTDNQNNPFYIPVDISVITIAASSAAAAVWIIVAARRIYRKKKKVQENNHADL